jgi:PIN domain nuclease of toxin-antitoxin system
MPTSVVDASALLAYLFDEAGGNQFPSLIGARPMISAVNWSEVHQKCGSRGVDVGELRQRLIDAGLEIADLTVSRAERVADLWPVTRPYGLSLADRACLALALELQRPTITADRAWLGLAVDGLVVRCLR